MASSTPVILAIADISGYTRFMHRHPVASSHAREITVRLLNAVVSRLTYPVQVAEIEGHAVFFLWSTGRRRTVGPSRTSSGSYSDFSAPFAMRWNASTPTLLERIVWKLRLRWSELRPPYRQSA